MYTTQEFAQKIKMKYPQYQGMKDTELVNKIIAKYPQYKDQVNLEQPGFLKTLTNTAMEFGSEVIGGVKSAAKDIYAGITQQEQKPEEMGVLSRFQERVGDAGKNIGAALRKQDELLRAPDETEIERVRREDYKRMGITLPDTTTNFSEVPMSLARDLFTGVGTPVVEEAGDLLLTGLKTIAPKGLEDATKKGFNETLRRLEIPELLQGFNYHYNRLKETNPDAAYELRQLGELTNIASNVIPVPIADDILRNTLPTMKKYATTGLVDELLPIVEQMVVKSKNAASSVGKKATETLTRSADNLIYEAVNPTKIENKMIIQERADDLKEYLVKNPIKNSLESVKDRIDADMEKAFRNMQEFEATEGIKGSLYTDTIIRQLEEKYFKNINGELLNKAEARIAQELIDTLEGFGPIVRDFDIIKVRKAWDKIEKANKGFMQSADANSKGEIFGDANRFFREEIHQSNPEYSEYLKQYSKTKTLSDVLDATITRRAGQTKGGFIRRGFSNTIRALGIGGGSAAGNPFMGWLAAEALIKGTEAVSSSGFKLTIAKILANLEKNGISTDNIVRAGDNIPGKGKPLNDAPKGPPIPADTPVGQRIVKALRNKQIKTPEEALAELMRKAERGFITPEEMRQIMQENPDLAELMLKYAKQEALDNMILELEKKTDLKGKLPEEAKTALIEAVKKGELSMEDLKYIKTNSKQLGKVIDEIDDMLTTEGFKPNEQGIYEKAPDIIYGNPAAEKKLLAPAKPKSKDYKVGLSPVRGRIDTQADALVTRAEKLYNEGNIEEATKVYDQAVKMNDDIIKKSFADTGITIKNRGAGFGIYDGKLEPNFDLTATVPEGKEELFHNILSEIADKKFKQYSTLTYKPSDAQEFGMVKDKPGVSIEPRVQVSFNRALDLEEINELYKYIKEADFPGGSIRDNGKTLDILNLSHYNADYETFAKNYEKFRELLDGFAKTRELTTSSKFDTQETWFAGNDTDTATTTYKQTQGSFREKNPDYLDTNQKYTSEVIEKIGFKRYVTRGEIEAMLKNGGISDIEKKAVTNILQKYDPKEKIPASQLQKDILGEMLPVGSKESNRYSSYGLDNIGVDPDAGTVKTIIFNTPVEHGKTGHFDDPNLFGHARIFLDGKKGYVVEVQSDLFQHDLPKDIAKFGEWRTVLPEKDQMRWEELNMKRDQGEKFTPEEKTEHDGLTEQLVKMRDDYVNSRQKDVEKLEAFGKKDKYRERIINETMEKLREEGATGMNVATPSTAAKVEGFVGNGENGVPYNYRNGDRITNSDPDLSVGDEIEFIGEEYVVVQTYPGDDSIVVAPKDSVNTFDLYDYTQDQVQYRFEEAVSELKDELDAGISPEKAQELIDSGNYSYDSDQILEKIAGQEDTVTANDIKLMEDNFKQAIEDKFDAAQDLEDIYGSDNVFFDGYHGQRATVVEEGTNTESLNQPSRYENDSEGLEVIDDDPSEMSNFYFGDDQKSVLKNYYELKTYLEKYAKENNIVMEKVEDPNGNTWYSIPITSGKIKGF